MRPPQAGDTVAQQGRPVRSGAQRRRFAGNSGIRPCAAQHESLQQALYKPA
jgi:hypothetical protein